MSQWNILNRTGLTNHYYDLDPQGRERAWTNFIICPLFLIDNDNRSSRIFELENENRIKRT